MHRLGEVQPCPMPTLEEILKITFKMYEDFKSTLTGN